MNKKKRRGGTGEGKEKKRFKLITTKTDSLYFASFGS